MEPRTESSAARTLVEEHPGVTSERIHDPVGGYGFGAVIAG
ncbi:hypothetical protein [Desulforamulus ruminis]|nr:hypothetical protein [Desulforamulus ruminis]